MKNYSLRNVFIYKNKCVKISRNKIMSFNGLMNGKYITDYNGCIYFVANYRNSLLKGVRNFVIQMILKETKVIVTPVINMV